MIHRRRNRSRSGGRQQHQVLITDIQNRFTELDEAIKGLATETPVSYPSSLSRTRSKLDLATDVSKEVLLVTKLTAQLLWALRTSKKWITKTIRLFSFVFFLFPALIQVFCYWLCSRTVHKNIPYGFNGRNLLDIYTVSQEKKTDAKRPVLVFFSGGAWIIGYKAWGALMGKFLSACGIVFVTPDYRNFPQGCMPDMLEDATLAMQWVFTNIHFFGGDPDNVTLMGQSAGAHIASCMLIDQVFKEGSGKALPWRPSRLRGFIGISGPYDLRKYADDFHRHGLDRSITQRIMANNMALYSPTLKILHTDICNQPNITACFPRVTLFHGKSDATISWHSTEDFADALERAGIKCVATKYFEGKSHTDPILEDPISGNDPLLDEILSLVTPGPVDYIPPKKMLPLFVINCARYVNPF